MSHVIQNKLLHRRRRGLVLLLALGMLALFSLLAVTYIIAASNSRAGAQAMKVRANASNTSTLGLTDEVMRQALRGTRDQKSAFYQHSMYEDIYDAKAMRVQFGNRSTDATTYPVFGTGAFNNNWCGRLTPTAGAGVELVKLSLDPRNPDNLAGNPSTYRLSAFENAYNARILTILEGPLAGFSFRILKYVGYVNADGSFPDPNTPTFPNYSRGDAYDYDYSIVIDLSEVQGSLSGRWRNPSTGLIENFSGTIGEWVGLGNGQGLKNLFYFFDSTANTLQGYRCVVNGAAFNNAAIGLEDDPASPGFGTVDGRRFIKASNVTRSLPPAVLPNYDYLQDGRLMANVGSQVGVAGIGDLAGMIRGQSNEGYDVPDWRDFWMSHIDRVETSGLTQPYIIPSFHRPELFNYISNLFGSPSSMSENDVAEMLLLLDASTARVLSYTFAQQGLSSNASFRPSSASAQLPVGFTWSSPPSPSEVATLRGYVRAHIEGPWDVDNDGDGIPESVWINPNLPSIHAPNGKMLKPLAAIHIEGLDGRINLNLHGDRIQGNAASFNAFADSAGFIRANLNGPVPLNLPQGFGYGPADISLNQLFQFEPNVLASGLSNYSIFDERYGGKHHHDSTAPVNLGGIDRSPGRRANGGFDGDDVVSLLRARESRYIDPAVTGSTIHGRLPGAPMGRRSAVAPAFDRNGNLAFVHPSVNDAFPENPGVNSIASERVNDAYETPTGLQTFAETNFNFTELEAILRRFDDDVEALPEHIREHLEELPGYNNLSEINRVITTRSAELRYPKLAAAATLSTGGVTSLEKEAGNFLGLVRLIHEQRYRKRSFPAAPLLDEPQMSVDALYELFPPEFSSNLRMDVNRAFGNGVDDDGNGDVDDPYEFTVSTEQEFKVAANGLSVQSSSVSGQYRNRQRQLGSFSRAYMGSRQLMARYLYCLGQLLIPRDYRFPTMGGETPNTLQWYRLRARAIAQWAVNVVDFRDSDVAMTRFEYDVFPLGINEASFGNKYNPKLPYWAPDRAPIDTDFVDVVWGMEMPELLLTESFALHDKRLRDTDMDDGPQTATNASMNPDPDMDQYRFPQGSLFLELYAPRTTYVPEDSRIAGTSRALYDIQAGIPVRLDLGRLAPADPSNYWGQQPVWRIGINASTPSGSPEAAQQPNAVYQTGGNPWPAAQRDFQASKSTVLIGDNLSAVPENRIGSGLFDSLADLGAPAPTGTQFERMIWFANATPSAYTRVPDLLGNTATDTNPNLTNLIYYNRTAGPALLEGGSYAVVGPRQETTFGSLANNPDSGAAWQSRLIRNQLSSNRPIRSPSHQAITLNPGSVATTLLNGETVFRYRDEWVPAVKPALGIICAADVPVETPTPGPGSRWQDCFPAGVGVNISMPNPIAGTGYWRATNKPLVRLNTDDLQSSRSDGRLGYADAAIPPDSWVDCEATGVGSFPDKPFDYDPLMNNILNPSAGSPMNQTGTYQNVRTAYLQRLADPNLPYDPVNNPYITVDWISLDLTVFNGEAPVGDDPNDSPGQVAFQSRYKDGAARNSAAGKVSLAGVGQPTSPGAKITQGGSEVWGYSYHSYSTAQLRTTNVQTLVTLNPPASGPQAIRYASYFMHQLGYATQQPPDAAGTQPKHHSATTLGYANVGYRFTALAGTATDDADDFDGFGPPQLVLGNVLYNGTPRDLTSLVWLNRPFATPAEMMLVPQTSPGQLGLYHTIPNPAQSRTPFEYLPSFQITNPLLTNVENGAPTDFADFPPSPDTPAVRNDVRQRGYWMRHAGQWPNSTTTVPVHSDFAFLFEFVETKPPFIDAARFLDPETIQAAAVSSAVARRFLDSYIPADFTGNSEPDTVRGGSLLAPTNEIPNYTAAGKINLNTITLADSGRSEALQALEYLYVVGTQRTGAARDSITQRFFQSRRGFAGGGASGFLGTASPPSMDPNYPTQFAGAFRSGLSTNLQPATPFPGESQANREPLVSQRGRYPIESGILRSYTPNQSATPIPNTGSVGNMLFSPDAVARIEDGSIPAVTPLEAEDAARNAFTRYQRAMRLPNLVTDQSNVFAVWVTVGLFEYDPMTGFGREYVNASGEEQRERAFYIIDRTVPVGFIPGEDLNTQKSVILRRKISGDR